MKFTVIYPFTADGEIYNPGDKHEADDKLVKAWEQAGLVKGEEQPKRTTKAKGDK